MNLYRICRVGYVVSFNLSVSQCVTGRQRTKYSMDWILQSNDVTMLLVFVIVFLFTYSFMKRNRTTTTIPGPFALPVVGNIPLLVRTPIPKVNQMLEELAKKYGDFFRIQAGNYTYVFVSGFDNIHDVFVKNSDYFNDRPNMLPGVARANASRGVLWANGDYWKRIRRFSLQTMRDFGVGKRSLENIVLEEIKSVDEHFEKHQRKPIYNMKEIMTIAVSNVIHNIVFGFRNPHEDETFRELLSSLDVLVKLSNFLSINIVLPLWMRVILHPIRTLSILKRTRMIRAYIKTQRKEHEASFDENNIRDFVDLYIKNTGTDKEDFYSEDTMMINIFHLFAAGTETTATTLDWAFLFMIGYPDVQQKCYDEINSVVGDARTVNMSDRSKLIYVEATLMEIQRLANTLYNTLPHMASDDITVSGHFIPKGTIMMGLLASAHRDTNYWKQPDKFDPHRFIDVNGKLLKPDAYVPFSLGPRICLGESLAKMELFLMFSNLIQRYKFLKVNESDDISFEGVSGITTSAPPHGVCVALR